MSDHLTAPWLPGVVDALNEYQTAGWMHEYTCGNDGHEVHVALVATTDGWVCPECPYTQTWAHAWSAQPCPWEEPQ